MSSLFIVLCNTWPTILTDLLGLELSFGGWKLGTLWGDYRQSRSSVWPMPDTKIFSYELMSRYHKLRAIWVQFVKVKNLFFKSAIVCLLSDFGLPPRCPQVVWCYWGEIGPFSATLAQDGLAECDQPGKIPWNTPPWLGIEPGPQGG